MNWLLPMMVIAGAPKAHRAALAEQLLPMALPGSQGLALAAIGAEQQIKRQAQNERRLVEEAIEAGKLAAPADLAAFPALDAAFKRLPVTVQSSLFSTTSRTAGMTEVPSTSRKRAGEGT